jgi:hypothetical protein
LRFLLFSGLCFAVYVSTPLLPALAVVLTVPLTGLLPPLQVALRGSAASFEWMSAAGWIRFVEVDFESLCANFVVLPPLILALHRPLLERLRKVGLGLALLLAFNELHLGVILLKGWAEATNSLAATRLGTVILGFVTIAYHMGEQLGSLVVPFLAFLILILRQRPGCAPRGPDGPGVTSPQ